MPATRPRKRASWKAIVAVAIVHFAIGFVLISGLHVTLIREAGEALNIIEMSEAERELEQSESAESPDPLEEGGAAPPDLRQEAAPIAAPEREIPVPTSNRTRAAPEPNDGFATDQGAAEVEGPGAGAGGEGDGTGSGAGGGPGGGAIVSRARRIAGDISADDHPQFGNRDRVQGTVGAEVNVGADGSVTGCRVVNSSGNAELDNTTCRLISERFRYEPARNARGEAVPDVAGRNQRWFVGRE